MEKHVPEEKVPSEKEQMEALRKKLISHKAFSVCRGKMFDVFFKIIEESKTPTQFLSMWDNQTSDMRVMGNLLAKYKRDGWLFAYESLKRSLMSDEYLFPEEVIPIDQTTPFTVIMLEPEKTLALINWLLGVHWMELNDYLDEKDGVTGRTFHSSGLTHKLFEYFPSLEEFSRERRMWCEFEGHDLLKAYNKEIRRSFGEDIFQDMESLKGRGLHLIQGQWNDHVEVVYCMHFVYAFPSEAKDILRKFNREQQKKMSIWTFNFPKIQMCEGFHPAIGLHVEEEQKKWFYKYPMNVSLNVSHGLGAILTHSRVDEKEYKLNMHGNYENDINRPIPKRFALSRYIE